MTTIKKTSKEESWQMEPRRTKMQTPRTKKMIKKTLKKTLMRSS